MRRFALALVLVGACAAPPPAATSQLPDGAVVLARVGEARALGFDGVRFYVVDGVASAVLVLDANGTETARLGGPGAGDGDLIDPQDVDPTNGQAVFVADGAGRVLRFTAEGRLASVLDVPDLADEYDASARRDIAAQTGRPVSVAVGPGGTLAVIEAGREQMLRWDRDRVIDRITGPPPRRPVALAIDDEGRTIVVSDQEVVVRDAFGAVETRIPASEVSGIQSVSVSMGRALVVGRRAFGVLDAGSLQDVRPVEIDEDLVDAVWTRSGVVALTRTRLFRLAADA